MFLPGAGCLSVQREDWIWSQTEHPRPRVILTERVTRHRNQKDCPEEQWDWRRRPTTRDTYAGNGPGPRTVAYRTTASFSSERHYRKIGYSSAGSGVDDPIEYVGEHIDTDKANPHYHRAADDGVHIRVEQGGRDILTDSRPGKDSFCQDAAF